MDSPYDVFYIQGGMTVWIGVAPTPTEALELIRKSANQFVGVYLLYCQDSDEKTYFAVDGAGSTTPIDAKS